MANTEQTPAVSFAEIIAPVSPDDFFATYYGKKWLHIPGAADKFPSILDWGMLTELLNKSGVWSSTTLGLVLDRKGVPILDYCDATKTADGKDVFRPDGPRVMALLRKGASLVANDIDSFTPGLTAVAATLEETLSAKVQGNLYCSWQQHQAFDSHFDTHDVYAIQLEGEKLWHLYEGCVDNPIAHPTFNDIPAPQQEELKGALAAEIVMRPGDVMYVPRGQYHDALAVSGNSMHITFGATSVIGLDYLSTLFEAAVDDPAFRADCPRPAEGRQRLAAYLEALGQRAEELSAEEEFVDKMAAVQAGFHYPRGGFDLPVTLDRGFALKPGFELIWNGAQAVLKGPRASLPVPAGLEQAMDWIVTEKTFTAAAFGAQHPLMAQAEREKLLGDLVGMKVLREE